MKKFAYGTRIVEAMTKTEAMEKIVSEQHLTKKEITDALDTTIEAILEVSVAKQEIKSAHVAAGNDHVLKVTLDYDRAVGPLDEFYKKLSNRKQELLQMLSEDDRDEWFDKIEQKTDTIKKTTKSYLNDFIG